MPGITLLRAKLTIHLANRDVRVPAMQIFDPFEFKFSVRIRMRGVRSVRLISERVFCFVEAFVPAHERGFGNMISPAYELNGAAAAVKLDGIISCINSMWQISL
jgi:hypothetical protein